METVRTPSHTTLEEVARKALARMRQEYALPQEAPGYILWAANPQEMRTVLREFREQAPLSPGARQALARMEEGLVEKGFTVLVLLTWGDLVLARGARVEIEVTPKA